MEGAQLPEADRYMSAFGKLPMEFTQERWEGFPRGGNTVSISLLEFPGQGTFDFYPEGVIRSFFW
eukprot:5927869-Amphidinium_carterae.1